MLRYVGLLLDKLRYVGLGSFGLVGLG